MTDWTNYKTTHWFGVALLGVLLGHPKMDSFDDGSGGELEELDNAYDEMVWLRDWVEW